MITTIWNWWTRQVGKLTAWGKVCAIGWLCMALVVMRFMAPGEAVIYGTLSLTALFCILKSL